MFRQVGAMGNHTEDSANDVRCSLDNLVSAPNCKRKSSDTYSEHSDEDSDDDHDVIDELDQQDIYEMDIDDLADFAFDNPEQFLDQYESGNRKAGKPEQVPHKKACRELSTKAADQAVTAVPSLAVDAARRQSAFMASDISSEHSGDTLPYDDEECYDEQYDQDSMSFRPIDKYAFEKAFGACSFFIRQHNFSGYKDAPVNSPLHPKADCCQVSHGGCQNF